MGRWTNKIKDLAIGFMDDYDDAMDEKFSNEFKIEFSKILHNNEIVTYDDIQGFLDSFETPDENDWALAKAESYLSDHEEEKLQQMKDERL